MAREVLTLLGDAEAREREGRSARDAAERRDLDAAARRHSEVYALAVQPF
jgi:hypothetical protein